MAWSAVSHLPLIRLVILPLPPSPLLVLLEMVRAGIKMQYYSAFTPLWFCVLPRYFTFPVSFPQCWKVRSLSMPGSLYTHPVCFKRAICLLGKIIYVSIRQLFFFEVFRCCISTLWNRPLWTSSPLSSLVLVKEPSLQLRFFTYHFSSVASSQCSCLTLRSSRDFGLWSFIFLDQGRFVALKPGRL